jgi:SAM-dependent methyltransferase
MDTLNHLTPDSKERACPVCGEGAAERALEVSEDRFGEVWRGWLWACARCGCLYLRHPPSQEEMDGFYRRCYARYSELLSPDRGPRKWLLDRFRKTAKLHFPEPLDSLEGIEGPKVLDYGCHDGHLLPLMEAKGWEAWGYDPTPHDSATHPGLRSGSFEALAGEMGLVDDILISHVLEHLEDPAATLRRLTHLLRPGGRLHVRIPNLDSPWRRLCGKGWIHWHAPFHFQHFRKSHIDDMVGGLGLRCVRAKSWTPTAWVASNLRNWCFPPKIFPDRRFHRNRSTESFLLLLILERFTRVMAGGGDALELTYRLAAPVEGDSTSLK